jgi:RimJ/RimL family protein N-acetyltransferase
MVRANSLHDGDILWGQHLDWLQKKLKSGNSLIYLFFNDADEAVGQVRLDLADNLALITFSVPQEFRRQGVGAMMIEEIIKMHPRLSFHAQVKASNNGSRRIFESLEFVRVESIVSNDVLIYTLTRI